MAAKPSITNNDLYKELRTMQNAYIKLDGRVENLEIDKIARDSANEAVEKFKAATARAKSDKTRLEILQALLPFLVALTALAYGIITYLGRIK